MPRILRQRARRGHGRCRFGAVGDTFGSIPYGPIRAGPLDPQRGELIRSCGAMEEVL